MTGSVHIVIVNWNTGDYLRRCLESIAAANREDSRSPASPSSTTTRATGRRTAWTTSTWTPRSRSSATARTSGSAPRATRGHGKAKPTTCSSSTPTRASSPTRSRSPPGLHGRRGLARTWASAERQVVDAEGRPLVSCARFPSAEDHVRQDDSPRPHRAAAASRASPRHGGADERAGGESGHRRFFLVRRGALRAARRASTRRYFIYYEEVDFSPARPPGAGGAPTSCARPRCCTARASAPPRPWTSASYHCFAAGALCAPGTPRWQVAVLTR